MMLAVGCKAKAVPETDPCGSTPALPYSEEAALSLNERLMPYLTGQTGSFSLRITSQEITSWIAYWKMERSEIPVSRVTIWFSPDRVHLDGVISRITPFSVRLRLHGQVWLAGSTPQVTLESACVGNSPLPGWLKSVVQRVINDTIVDSGPILRCDELRIGQDELFAAGQIGP